MPLRYVDFDLRIERVGSRYKCLVLDSPAGEAAGTFVLPFSSDKIENLILKVGRRVVGMRGVQSAEMEAARELGESLYAALFNGEIGDCYRRSLDAIIREEGAGLRLRLRLQDVPELGDLPWEFLRDQAGGRFLAQSAQTPVVRYIEMAQSVRPVATTLPLRILVMISAPVDVPGLDLQLERTRLEASLEPLRKHGKVEVTWLEDATLSALQRHLRNETYHIFHFVGHGAFDAKREVGLLILEGEAERAFPVESDRIGTFLHDHPSLRLAVLNSCEGARNSRDDPFAGVAANLVRQGIPAVVAMQFEISDDAAITFAGEFYAALAEGQPVDTAVAEARKAIYATNDVEWATPVLYMRSPNGVLFELQDHDTPEKRDSLARARAEIRQNQQKAVEARRSQEAEIPRAKSPRPVPDNSLHKVFIGSAAILGIIALIAVAAIDDPITPPPPAPSFEPVVPSTTYDIPSLQANVANIRFFEGGAAPAYKSERVYRTTFPPTSRFITTELELRHRSPASVLEAKFPCTYYQPDGTVEGRVEVTGDLQPGDTVTWLARGWGSREGGSWGPGTYRVTCTFEGSTVARETFSIRPTVPVRPPTTRPLPPASAYDIPALKARVTGMRFFESPDPPQDLGDRAFAKRFSRQTARYIYFQLYVVYPAPRRVLEYPANCTYYHDGIEWGHVAVNVQIQPDWTDSWHWGGRGWNVPGQWLPGTYRVKCMVDTRVVAEQTFEVY